MEYTHKCKALKFISSGFTIKFIAATRTSCLIMFVHGQMQGGRSSGKFRFVQNGILEYLAKNFLF